MCVAQLRLAPACCERSRACGSAFRRAWRMATLLTSSKLHTVFDVLDANHNGGGGAWVRPQPPPSQHLLGVALQCADRQADADELQAAMEAGRLAAGRPRSPQGGVSLKIRCARRLQGWHLRTCNRALLHQVTCDLDACCPAANLGCFCASWSLVR